MPFPVIGLTARHGKDDRDLSTDARLRAYADAVIQAGGAPELIPYGLTGESLQAFYGHLDGILFTGGGDIAIERFDGQPHDAIRQPDEARDELEFALVEAAVSDRRPFLGICRGFQVINVALGGTLYTHIKDQMPNAIQHKYSSKARRAYLAHAVEVAEGSRLADILGETKLSVNSMHHQGAKDIAAALKPVAYAPDGLVEAVELPDHPFGVAVQWHPECLPDQPSTRRLFRAFVEAADDYHKR